MTGLIPANIARQGVSETGGHRTILDAVRWTSAFVVLFGHCLGLVFTRPPAIELSSVLGIVNYIAELRGVAVTMFFVVSGYLVGGSVLERAGAFDFKQYALSRFVRIYIVLAPAIILILALDIAAGALWPGSPVYNSVWPSGVLGDTPIYERYGVLNWVATILSLENFVGRPLGSGGALWSLGYEWVFYFVMPILVLGGRRINATWGPYAAIGLALVVLVVTRQLFTAMFFGIWIAGAVARMLWLKRQTWVLVRFGGALLATAGVLTAPFFGGKIASVLVGLGFSAFLATLSSRERGFDARIDERLASFSYSLYVTHLSVITFVAAGANYFGYLGVNGRAVDVQGCALVLVMVIFSLGVASIFGAMFEDRTALLKGWLSRNISLFR
jgi:peptidoglycan/LPS O-acetylase OafA/YrhL